MVAKKHASKRRTLRDKYKIVRRVAEHKRKLKKLAKKNPQLAAAKLKRKKANDLGESEDFIYNNILLYYIDFLTYLKYIST